MKALAYLTCIILICALIFGLVNGGNEIDDTEDRTYRGTVYDSAYYLSEHDGMRARAYYYYLFCESENKVLMCTHTSAGSGKTYIKYGTYEGSFEDGITITIDGETSTFTFSDNEMYGNNGDDVYSAENVKSAIIQIQNWD